MAIIVSDANVFIDLEVADITHLMFRLPYEFVVPDVLYEEELADHHSHLRPLGLRTETLDAQAVRETEHLLLRYSTLGLHDVMALALAKRTQRTLLTGDAKLRATAIVEDVDTRGTLWLMEEMHSIAVIRVDDMAGAYETMRQAGRRLPWDDVARQLRRLRRRR